MGYPLSSAIETARPVAVAWISVTRPTLMPRRVTWEVDIKPPELFNMSVM
ncbi:Uncharacterised protein [Mycobacteroides abscessus subsp. abscessus]|nr:Uncharacterised protein [Mycobacteroides abscessus subsp. abscessus]